MPDADPPVAPPGRRVLGFVGTIVAPTTLVTALLFFFGYLHAYWFFDYFRVNSSVLGFTPQDFLIRATDGLSLPCGMAAVAALVGVWGLRLSRGRLSGRWWRVLRRWAAPLVAVPAVGLGVVAVLGAVVPGFLARQPWLPGLALAAAVLLLAAVPRLRPPGDHPDPVERPGVAVVEWAAGFVLVAAGLFWAAGQYSAAVGTGRAHDVVRSLASTADVIVFSEKSLALRAKGVTETACGSTDAAYGVRYDGLKLILQAGDRYVFLPAGWSRTDGAAVVVPRTDTMRLEFVAPGRPRVPAC